jgi:hypothetical protein
MPGRILGVSHASELADSGIGLNKTDRSWAIVARLPPFPTRLKTGANAAIGSTQVGLYLQADRVGLLDRGGHSNRR